ncbi:MAG: hypothetical protein OEY85_13815 [Rhodospirillales bacterium]|nr:hypothetical protein [Rhodospirillales bacterium]
MQVEQPNERRKNKRSTRTFERRHHDAEDVRIIKLLEEMGVDQVKHTLVQNRFGAMTGTARRWLAEQTETEKKKKISAFTIAGLIAVLGGIVGGIFFYMYFFR